MAGDLQIHTIVSVPFDENTYIVWQAGRTDVLVIDPGLEPELILSFLEENGLNVAAILNTHGHADHIAGNEALKTRYPQAPLIIGINEVKLLGDPQLNLSAPFGMSIVSPPADRVVNEGEVLVLAGITLEVREIPGHSPGHVVFVTRSTLTPGPSPGGRGEKDAGPSVGGRGEIVFGGDVLFRGSVGRCDFPGGSMEQLAEGIRKKLYTMPDDTVVYPGHGPVTTIGQEKRTNPFVQGQ